ncbi:hypothetical protein DNU06_09960 [Putridiphycobacter roseus]|uniref:RHS repeat-associated core domain-containing protein n=2 Tax=Putridiphycobacter roseus TaxID=2219161 RepID=A0A2W1NGR2_9FLAO|nr:hypothetical protein DNU06_09960 [Putridiphycobacter roseus]
MMLPNRNETQGDGYRYGFNGMEKDDEVKGNNNSYTTEFRQYDPRVARWLSRDPINHPFFSPYSAFDNNPIFYRDPSGADGEPENRELNSDINGGAGDASKAGQSGTDEDGRKFVYADVSQNGSPENKTANAYRIWLNGVAVPGKVDLTDKDAIVKSKEAFYGWNPGLKNNKTKIGQGQKIYIEGPKTIIEKTEEQPSKSKLLKFAKIIIDLNLPKTWPEGWSSDLEEKYNEYINDPRNSGEIVKIKKKAKTWEENEKLRREMWRHSTPQDQNGDRFVEDPFWGFDESKTTTQIHKLKVGDTAILYSKAREGYYLYVKTTKTTGTITGIESLNKQATEKDVKKFAN